MTPRDWRKYEWLEHTPEELIRFCNSRQRAWQLRQRAAGNCEKCGKPRKPCPSVAHCSQCLMKARLRERRDHGWSPWVPGGRGRPPLEVKGT